MRSGQKGLTGGILAQYAAGGVRTILVTCTDGAVGEISDPSLATLVKLNDEGLLEPYVLLTRADAGIARDYATYRKGHRDKLRSYMDEYVVPKDQ